MLLMPAIVVAGAALAYPGPGLYVDGEMLLTNCTQQGFEYEATVAMGNCSGYITGIVDASASTFSVTVRNQICYPPDVAYADFLDIVVAYIRSHPKRLKQPAAPLVLEAMATAYPCAKTK